MIDWQVLIACSITLWVAGCQSTQLPTPSGPANPAQSSVSQVPPAPPPAAAPQPQEAEAVYDPEHPSASEVEKWAPHAPASPGPFFAHQLTADEIRKVEVQVAQQMRRPRLSSVSTW